MADTDVHIQEARVTYSTKELLKDIYTRLDAIDQAVSAIPTRSEMEHAEKRISHLESWRTTVDAVRLDRAQQFGVRERTIGVAVAVGLFAMQLHTAGIFF